MLRQIQNKDWSVVNKWLLDIASESFDKVIPEILKKKFKKIIKKNLKVS